MTTQSTEKFDDHAMSTVTRYELITTINQIAGFDVRIDSLLAELIPLIHHSPFINAELPVDVLNPVLQYHLQSQGHNIQKLSEVCRTKVYFASEGIILNDK